MHGMPKHVAFQTDDSIAICAWHSELIGPAALYITFMLLINAVGLIKKIPGAKTLMKCKALTHKFCFKKKLFFFMALHFYQEI